MWSPSNASAAYIGLDTSIWVNVQSRIEILLTMLVNF